MTDKFTKVIQLSFALLMIVSMSACTTQQPSAIVETPYVLGNYKFNAWQLDDSTEKKAANTLLKSADVLIEGSGYNKAVDKIERSLRIAPNYAVAWSRLAWLALQMKLPQRAMQMAKRSNSDAFSNPDLQSLNWSFIQRAQNALKSN